MTPAHAVEPKTSAEQSGSSSPAPTSTPGTHRSAAQKFSPPLRTPRGAGGISTQHPRVTSTPSGLGLSPCHGADTVLGALVSHSTPLWPELGVPAPTFRMSKLRLWEADLSRVPELRIRLALRLLLPIARPGRWAVCRGQPSQPPRCVSCCSHLPRLHFLVLSPV